jgi:hypothetical protein
MGINPPDLECAVRAIQRGERDRWTVTNEVVQETKDPTPSGLGRKFTAMNQAIQQRENARILLIQAAEHLIAKTNNACTYKVRYLQFRKDLAVAEIRRKAQGVEWADIRRQEENQTAQCSCQSKRGEVSADCYTAGCPSPGLASTIRSSLL